MMTTIFDVAGPFEIPFDTEGRAKHISDGHVKAFWDIHNQIGGRAGCYIFALRSSKGFSPWYVGKATKSFQQECFADHKLRKYNRLLFKGDKKGAPPKGTPVMFFIVLPTKPGRNDARSIAEIEKFLILQAYRANEHILNKQGKKKLKWGIGGIVNSGKGKYPKESIPVRKMLRMG